MINHLKTIKMNGTIRTFLLMLLLSTIMPAIGQTAGKGVQTKVISHRGYWKTEGSAQNSVTSFLKADSISSYGSELDVWLTADSVLIANHDRVFKGLAMETSLSGDILATRLSNGEYVPSFEAILGAMRKTSATRLILEIKNLKDKSKYPYEVGLVARLLEKYGVADRTEIIVFAHELGASASGRCPERGSSTSTATSPRQNSKSGDMPEWITATLSSKPTNTGSPKHMLSGWK